MRRGFLATETPRCWCESQEGPCVQDGLAPFSLCAHLCLSLPLGPQSSCCVPRQRPGPEDPTRQKKFFVQLTENSV